MDVAWFQSRYDKAGPGGTGKDYINCPMDKPSYEAFVDALLAGDKHEHQDWEKVPYFDGCLPIEVMAERGRETLRHGPMKPVGLTNAHQPGEKPYAVVQLRQDNALGTLYNMVGFQTKLKLRRAGRHLPHDPRPRARRSSRGSAACTATPSSTRRSCSTPTLRLKAHAAPALRRPDHRLRGLCRMGGDRPARRPLRRRRAARRGARRCRRRPRPSARCSATSPAATSWPTTSRASAPSSR